MLLAFYSKVDAQLVYPNIYVQIDSSWTYEMLRLIPVKFVGSSDQKLEWNGKNVISLQEAMASKKIEIKEFYYMGDANVKLLQLKNKSHYYIMLNSGDIIAGGKQDRMLAESKLLLPKTEQDFIDVYCVEKGRWSKKNASFKYVGNADEMLRKIMDSTGNQHFIWDEIEKRLPEADKWTTTWPYAEAYQKNNAALLPYLQFFENKLKQSDSSFAGFIATAADSTIIGCELFVATTLTNVAFKNMVSGWAQTAIRKTNSYPTWPSKKAILKYANTFLETEEAQQKFILKHGKAFYHQKQLFHLVVHGFLIP